MTDPGGRDGRRLPTPPARVATAVVRTPAAPGGRRRAAARPGGGTAADLTVPAGGGKCTRAEVEKSLPGAAGVPDVYHATEPLHAAAVTPHRARRPRRDTRPAAGLCWGWGPRAC